MKHICPHCGIECEKATGLINRANKVGSPIYCSKVCSGLARRSNKSSEQLKAEKAKYDAAYRETNASKLKRQKSERHQRVYDPVKQREYNQNRMPLHIEYCRQTEYRAKKVGYDREYRAKKFYGEFYECAIIVEQINNKLIEMADKAELRTIQGTNTKSLKRKRQWLRLMTNLRQLT